MRAGAAAAALLLMCHLNQSAAVFRAAASLACSLAIFIQSDDFSGRFSSLFLHPCKREKPFLFSMCPTTVHEEALVRLLFFEPFCFTHTSLQQQTLSLLLCTIPSLSLSLSLFLSSFQALIVVRSQQGRLKVRQSARARRRASNKDIEKVC
jgi:hypothetical protein